VIIPFIIIISIIIITLRCS